MSNDGDDCASVVRRDVEFVAEVGALLMVMLLLLLLLFRLKRRIVERRVREDERHMKRRAERANGADGGRSVRRQERKHAGFHHLTYYNDQETISTTIYGQQRCIYIA